MNQHWYRTLKLPSPSIAFHLPPSPSVEPSSLSIPFHLPRSPSGATHDRVAQLYQVAACMQSHSYLHIVARSSYLLVAPRSSSFISLSLCISSYLLASSSSAAASSGRRPPSRSAGTWTKSHLSLPCCCSPYQHKRGLKLAMCLIPLACSWLPHKGIKPAGTRPSSAH